MENTQTLTKYNMEITLETLKARPLSYSSLIAFKRSPLHYMQYLVEKRKATPAMAMGSLIDCLLLTPDKYEDRYIIKPDFSKGEGVRARAKAWEEENKGKTWISDVMLAEAKLIVLAVQKNPISKEYIDQVTASQKKIEWTDKETGLPMIAYLDLESEKFIADLKSTADAHPEEFMKSAFNFDYHIQTAIYLDAAAHRGKFPDFYHIAVEKKAPYGVSVLKSSKQFIELGTQEYRKLLQEFKFCMEHNLWDQSYEFSAPAGYYQMELPGWALNKISK